VKEADRAELLKQSLWERKVCFPCAMHEHKACRHRGNGPEFKARDHDEGPCMCEESQHKLLDGLCYAHVRGDRSSGHPCWKPAKRTIRVRPTFSRRGEEVEVPACGLHASVHDRRVARDETWRAERQANREADQRAKELCRSVDDTIEMAREIFIRDGGLDIPIGHDHGKHDRCGGGVVISAEHLRALARLVEDASEITYQG
jgi:hypothetical protein